MKKERSLKLTMGKQSTGLGGLSYPSFLKFFFDFVVALFGLVLLSPLMLLVAVLVKLTSPGPVFFKQERMGKDFRPFEIYKFRTMSQNAPQEGGAITVGEDPRITRVGWFLRKTKIDEIPQLINIIRGEMSIVGPRPEVRKFVEMFQSDYAEVLKVRPGISDMASVKYRNESEVLAESDDPDEEYITRLLPDKIKLNKEYVGNISFFYDLKVIGLTIKRLFETGS